MSKHIELYNFIHESCKELDFSGVVLVKQGTEVLSESAHDFANRSDRLPNTPGTRFGIASGSKLFTSIGIGQLVEKGVLSFNTRLKDCLDIDFPHFDDGVTIHHLLTHTSGIPDYFDEEVMTDFEELWKETPVYHMRSLGDFLPFFQSNRMKFAPGDRFHYNNAGFILLGLIIEQQTGKSFTDHIESEIFQKAGMDRSGYFSLDRLPHSTAFGYIEDKEENTWRTNLYSIPVKGGADGGAFITASDMMSLWEALFSYKLVNEETTRKLLTPHVHVNGEVHYGYGIWMNQRDDEIYKFHVMGYDPGVSFRSSYYPQLDLKLAIPSNRESGPFEVTKAIEGYFGI
jgi:CubicO group peptidase (beta-lactamase class C family)